MENAALAVRLDAQHDVLVRIEEHLVRLNGRVLGAEKWQSNADAVLDSLNERVDINTERSEQHQSYIDQQKGGTGMRVQIASGLVAIFGIIALVLKMLFPKLLGG